MYENGGAICGEKRTTNRTNKLHKNKTIIKRMDYFPY